MGLLDAWFDKMKAEVTEVIEREGVPAFDRFNAMASEVVKQALAAKQRLEAAALEAAEAARTASRSVAVKAGRVVIDAEFEDEGAADDEESEEDSGDE